MDLHNCDHLTFNRKQIKKYFVELCNLIEMERAKLTWWDDIGVPKNEQQTLPHTKGTTAVQFILTSNITIHTLDILKCVYVNIFSCKEFDSKSAEEFTKNWFKGEIVNSTTIIRK
ncbi:MAG: S-adenosylmethionine decarboxylase [Bacteroidetes bacterium]|nr:S-adenosylmethionine decarboxylase [Bacteroidota bacterium]